MKFKIFSVHDAAADAYINPFFMPTTAMAERIFKQMVNEETHQFYISPVDYTLFELGEFDQDSGAIDADNPIRINSGTFYKNLE